MMEVTSGRSIGAGGGSVIACGPLTTYPLCKTTCRPWELSEIKGPLRLRETLGTRESGAIEALQPSLGEE